MDATKIWIVVFAKPRKSDLYPLFKERRSTGVDLMYSKRTMDAKRLEVGDRVVAHYGGPRGSDYRAQSLVLAGCVAEKARYLQATDVQKYKVLYDLTRAGFGGSPHRPGGPQGIIFYSWFEPPLRCRPTSTTVCRLPAAPGR